MILFIDPGKTGGAIILNRDGGVETVEFAGCGETAVALLEASQFIDGAYIEDIHASGQMIPKQSFEFGRNLGHWEGILAAMETDVITRIQPYAWQKAVGVPKGLDYGKRKTWLYRKSVELVGKENTSRALCDAWLIAWYYRETYPLLKAAFDDMGSHE
jgi:hypothetical protein